MYSVVMMLALSGGTESPDLFFRRRCGGCYACYGGYGCYGYRTAYWGCCGCVGYYYPYAVAPAAPAPSVMTYYPSAPAPKQGQGADETQFVNLQNQDRDTRRAVILVTAPIAAKLTFNGWTATGNAGKRRFRSPPLEPGKSYVYTVRAELVRDGQTLVETQQVVVRAGQQTSVPIQFPGALLTQR